MLGRDDDFFKSHRRSVASMFACWCVSVVVLGGVSLGFLCGVIYFVFWCLREFGVIS